MRFYGGGYVTGSGADEIQPYPLSAETAIDCAATCAVYPNCRMYVWHERDRGCFHMTTPFTGTNLDPAFVSGTCDGNDGQLQPEAGKCYMCTCVRAWADTCAGAQAVGCAGLGGLALAVCNAAVLCHFCAHNDTAQLQFNVNVLLCLSRVPLPTQLVWASAPVAAWACVSWEAATQRLSSPTRSSRSLPQRAPPPALATLSAASMFGMRRVKCATA